MDEDSGAWDDIYRNARKSEKLKFEDNERDEGELERTGQPVSIYEIYSGAGAWPFLHHGSLYRGLSLVSFISFVFIYSLFHHCSFNGWPSVSNLNLLSWFGDFWVKHTEAHTHTFGSFLSIIETACAFHR